KLFEILSAYDDYLYFTENRKNYNPGSTLALIAPFLLAFGITDEQITEVAEKNITFIPDAKETLGVMKTIGLTPCLISTSYEQYVDAVADRLEIPPDNNIYRTHKTPFPIDKYKDKITDEQKNWAKKLAEKIVSLKKLNIEADTDEKDFDDDDWETIDQLNDIFDELHEGAYREVLDDVKPNGGPLKYESLEKVMKKNHMNPEQMVAIGDSITDEDMFKNTRENGGIAISFNGNSFALEEADIAIVSDTTAVTGVLVDLYHSAIEKYKEEGEDNFYEKAHKKLKEVVENWDNDTTHNLELLRNEGYLHNEMYLLYRDAMRNMPKGKTAEVYWLRDDSDNKIDNYKDILELSVIKRKQVRDAVGNLG
ncbi:MAG: hypothetical protein KAT91_03050, partial [Candidatus Aenigmarchaeota archaeon]|nr:hypothetical protein [Candidatus Aenigmarchaeota archaeon]